MLLTVTSDTSHFLFFNIDFTLPNSQHWDYFANCKGRINFRKQIIRINSNVISTCCTIRTALLIDDINEHDVMVSNSEQINYH